MASNIDIASNALVLIGDNPISSFSEPGAGATAASNLYEGVYQAFLSYHPWTFALKEQQLSRLSAAPPLITGFLYQFQMPTDCIRVWIVYPKQTRYELVGDRLYSNEPAITMRYNWRVDETALPPYAVKAIEYALAADFAQLVTESTSKSEYFNKKYSQALAVALGTDSQGHPPQQIIDSPFLDVR